MKPNRLIFTFAIAVTAVLWMFFSGQLNYLMIAFLLLVILPMGLLPIWMNIRAKKMKSKGGEDER